MAALVAELDLVISVDTSIAHLAGALARPTWILLASGADWRWHPLRATAPGTRPRASFASPVSATGRQSFCVCATSSPARAEPRCPQDRKDPQAMPRSATRTRRGSAAMQPPPKRIVARRSRTASTMRAHGHCSALRCGTAILPGPKRPCVARWSAIRALSMRRFSSAICCASKGNGRLPLPPMKPPCRSRRTMRPSRTIWRSRSTRAGDAPRAIDTWRDVLRVHPGHRQAVGNLIHVLCRERQHEEATRLFERHVRGMADIDAGIWLDYGISKYRLLDYPAAEAAFRRALSLAPGDALILVNLRLLLVDAGDYENAEPAGLAGTRARPGSRLSRPRSSKRAGRICATGAPARRCARAFSSAFRVTTGTRESTIRSRRCRCPCRPRRSCASPSAGRIRCFRPPEPARSPDPARRARASQGSASDTYRRIFALTRSPSC